VSTTGTTTTIAAAFPCRRLPNVSGGVFDVGDIWIRRLIQPIDFLPANSLTSTQERCWLARGRPLIRAEDAGLIPVGVQSQQ